MAATPRATAIRLRVAADGSLHQIHVDWTTGSGGGTAVYHQDGFQAGALASLAATDSWQGDGATTAFTTRQAVYGGTAGIISAGVDGQPQTYTAAANADGTVTVTLATAPADLARVTVGYSTGAGFANAGGDLASVLSLTQGSGTVWGAGGAATAHQHVKDYLQALLEWAAARLAADL